jgi:hypothetical protein
MFLLWTIRYLDSRDKQFKNRQLWLNTNKLEPVSQAAVELINANRKSGPTRDIIRFRQLFREGPSDPGVANLFSVDEEISFFSLDDYFEDENGLRLSNKQMAVILSGNPNAVMFPSGYRQHDIKFALAPPQSIPIEQISIPQDSLAVLGYFVRDLRELMASSFLREGPGTLISSPDGPVVKTAVSDEEIRSYITSFRRLYMASEPAGFLKAASIFTTCCAGYPLTEWISDTAQLYDKELQSAVQFVPWIVANTISFTRKRLLDVFIYTQYAHQPNNDRQRQFLECLNAVNGKTALLTWLFLTELQRCSLHIINAGRPIAGVFEKYCQCHNAVPAVVQSLSQGNPLLGVLEKKEDQQKRLFVDKASEIAAALWKQNGSPNGGPEQFLNEARESLAKAMGKGSD